MLRSSPRFNLLATLLLATTACTQEPAMVELKGQNTYSRDGVSSYAAISPASGGYNNNSSSYQPAPVYRNVSTSTESSAQVQSIGVSDLSPPSGGKSTQTASNSYSTGGKSWTAPARTENAPFKPAASEVKAVDAGREDDQKINPWTRKPRSMASSGASSRAASDALDESFHIRPQGKTAGKKEPMVSEVKIIRVPENTEKLDGIVSNDAPIVKKAASAAKPVKADAPASVAGFMWPVNSKKVISGFGPKGGGKVNDGINIASADGEPVWAAADGEVVYVGNELQGYGNMVLVKHNGNKTTAYAHLGRANVDKYDRVRQGDIIGYVGNSGSVKRPQLHFAIRDGKEPVDPIKYLNRNVASLR